MAPVWLDRAEHIEALLNAAGELDQQAEIKGGQDQKGGLVYRRALLATLVFAGPRIGELTALRWRDVDLAGYRITVRESKTDAGIRQIDILPALHDELRAHKAHAPSTAPDAFVFATATGTELAQGNVRRRLLALVAGTDWAPSGTGAQNGGLADLLTATPPVPKTAR